MNTRNDDAPDLKRRLADLLLDPREDLEIELKGWLSFTDDRDKANLAQAILALANHGGGHILIGFKEDGASWVPDPERRVDLSSYTQDAVNGMVKRYADPSFQCGLRVERHPETGEPFPVVVVPGRHKVPIRSKRSGPNRDHVKENTYYIRGSGPASRPIESAREWDDLIRRCIMAARESLLDDIRTVLLGSPPEAATGKEANTEKEAFSVFLRKASERWQALSRSESVPDSFAQMQQSHWTVGYHLLPQIEPTSLSEFLDILREVRGHETGWPPWLVPTQKEAAPYVLDDCVECWLGNDAFDDPAYADFWRADPRGMLLLIRAYQEDSVKTLVPGKFFDFTLPMWRIGECLLHAQRLALRLGSDSARVRFVASWTGLQGRELTNVANPRKWVRERKVARQDSAESEVTVPAENISTALPELVHGLTSRLYEVFDFTNCPVQVVQEELAKMQGTK